MVYDTITADWQYNPVALNNKMDLINEIDYQNLSDVSGWEYIEKNIHLTRWLHFWKVTRDFEMVENFIVTFRFTTCLNKK